MVAICFYFQVHQPFRISKFRVFDIGKRDDYFDEQRNKDILASVAFKSYLPMNQLILDLIEQTNKKFKVAFSISGTALEQMQTYAPEVLESFQKLARTGCVEFLSETYYHSLSFIYSKAEFKRQVELHKEAIKKYFGQEPKVFRNTELIYSNEIANFAEEMGYKGIFAEGWEKALKGRSPNHLYHPKDSKGNIALFTKNYSLSDDIAFRFANKNWEHFPLTPSKYAKWINEINKDDDIINLFLDYETFGEHQKEETGIFDFFREMPFEILKNQNNSFVTPSEAISKFKKKEEVDIPYYTSWADEERDVSAWLGNKMQKEAMREVYEIETIVKSLKQRKYIEEWRKLTTSDHFYYMSTKDTRDGIIHELFSIYDSPYDAYVYYMNILNDLVLRIKLAEEKHKTQQSMMKEPKKGILHDIKNIIKN